MFFCLGEFLARIDGHKLAPRLGSNVRVLPELDKAIVVPSYSTHTTGEDLSAVLKYEGAENGL